MLFRLPSFESHRVVANINGLRPFKKRPTLQKFAEAFEKRSNHENRPFIHSRSDRFFFNSPRQLFFFIQSMCCQTLSKFINCAIHGTKSRRENRQSTARLSSPFFFTGPTGGNPELLSNKKKELVLCTFYRFYCHSHCAAGYYFPDIFYAAGNIHRRYAVPAENNGKDSINNVTDHRNCKSPQPVLPQQNRYKFSQRDKI